MTRAPMNLIIQATNEKHTQHVNGVPVTFRIYEGNTAGGVPVEVYVFSVVPKDEARFLEELRAQGFIPERTRDVYDIKPDGKP